MSLTYGTTIFLPFILFVTESQNKWLLKTHKCMKHKKNNL